MKYVVLLGRILFSAIFLMSVGNHFSRNGVSYADSHGVPWASVLVPLGGIISLLGALSILLGYKAKTGLGCWLYSWCRLRCLCIISGQSVTLT